MTNPSRVSVTIHAGPITATDNPAGIAGRQIKLNDNSYLYMTPEAAKQWLPIIATIAAEDK